MKILVLTKRYTSAKDISKEDVGRPFCLFAALSSLGHEVSFLLGDYTDKETADVMRRGIRLKIRPLTPARFFLFRSLVREELVSGKYDILIAEGDPLFALIASGPCRKIGVPLVYDLMDNYETYDIYRFPFFSHVDRRLMRRADSLVCVTEALKEKVSAVRSNGVYVVGNGVDTEMFRPLPRAQCRQRLGLPPGIKLIGYFGYIVDYKGVDLLLEANRILRRDGFSTAVLLAGPRHSSVATETEGVIYRGLVAQADIPSYVNACDVIVVPSPSNTYTDYCFPLKVLEGAACGIPVAATNLRPVRELLGADYPLLLRPGDAMDHARKIRLACTESKGINLRTLSRRFTWVEMARSLDRALKETLS